MIFYELPPAINKVINDPSVRVFIRLCFEAVQEGKEYWIPESDIISCDFSSYKISEGGIINVGEVILDNTRGIYNTELNPAFDKGLAVHVYFCFGSNENLFLRFNLYVDDRGFQTEQTGFDLRTTKINLIDLSVMLNDNKVQNNWLGKAVVVHSVICDKEHPENSLVHIIAKRCGLSAKDIDCGNLPFNIPYVEINKTVWQELCDISSIYKANLECGKDMPLSFTESPYDQENKFNDEASFFLGPENIIHYRSFNVAEKFYNNIRIKYTHYIETVRQKLWEYCDAPAWYDELMNVVYPFTNDTRRIISDDDYQAIYTARNENGNIRNVVYAEELDDQLTFESNIETADNKKFTVLNYDTSSYNDRAIIKLSRNNQLIALKNAAIYGRAIIAEPNYAVYIKDQNSVKIHGPVVKNITSKYFSDDLYKGVPFYKVRAEDFLNDHNKIKRGYYITTSLALVHGRVGACLSINVGDSISDKKVRIEELTFRYKRNGGFVTEMWVETV